MNINEKIILRVSTMGVGLMAQGAGITGAMANVVHEDREFVPEEGMPTRDLVDVLGTYINVKLTGAALTPEEFEALPDNVKKYFKKI